MSKYKNKDRKQRKKTDPEEIAQLDRTAVFILVSILVFFFGSVASYNLIYNYMYGPDPSVDLQAVKTDLLIKPHHASKDLKSAKAVIVEFMDPECVLCRSVFWDLKRLEQEYGKKIKVVLRYLPEHVNSRLVAALLEESKESGVFEKALETVFQNQALWGSHTDPNPELILDYLAALGMDKSKLDQEKILQKQNWKIDLDEKDAHFLGVRSSHTFFINGKLIKRFDYDSLKKSIHLAMNSNGPITL